MHITMGKNTSCAENPDHGSQMPKKYPKTWGGAKKEGTCLIE